MKKKQMSFRLPENTIKALKICALKKNKTLAYYVEDLFKNKLQEELDLGNITEDLIE